MVSGPSSVSAVLRGAAALIAALSQTQTNGASLLGSLQAPTFPAFLTNNPLPNGFPWGSLTAGGSNPFTSAPNTGVIRSYDFTITRGTIAPDGYSKAAVLVNGGFPGPTIEANWGDTIQVTVHNKLSGPEEGTSIHWHGLRQSKTPWYDGVPSVQQCPIAPGSSFTYSFQADLYGTTWYHSHYENQYADGLLGAIVIHGPKNAAYDIDLGPVFLTDYYHTNASVIESHILSNGSDFNPIPFSDNNLINGKMNFNCSTVAAGDTTPCVNNAGISKFNFTQGKTHRLRLINAGAEGYQMFSIDGHNMTVIANDLVPIQPYTTDMVRLHIGQRADVLVTANHLANSSWWMRSNISTTCSFANQPDALAAVYYNKADTTLKPTSAPIVYTDDNVCVGDAISKSVPFYPLKPQAPTTTLGLNITAFVNATGHFQWAINGSPFHADYNSPVLLQAQEGNLTFPTNWNVENFGTNTSIRLNIYNPTGAAHPMHLHGHNFYVLHEGAGEWDGTTIVNPNNPLRRDTQVVEGNGHLIVQFEADNPGVWPLHCHIAWHVATGLYANILERPDKITSMQIPQVMAQTCTDWDKWSSKDVVDQIDSGV